MTKDEELEQLRHDNQILREALKEAIEAMSYLQERVKALEGQQAKDSHNSHLPPSSDRFVRAPKSLRQKSDKKPGGQPGHPGHHLLRKQAPDHLVVHGVDTGEQCQQDLRAQAAQLPESRHVLDLPPQRLWVTEHRVEEKACPACGHRTRAAFPSQLRAPTQYGAGIQAVAVYLVEGQLLPYERASQLLGELFGVQLSAGSIATFVGHGHQQLAPVEALIKEALIQAKVLHQDETGLRVKLEGHWMHVCSTERLTHYAAHPKRGRAALEEIGIAPRFHGTSVHDGLASYQSYACGHALCNVHHLRELTSVEEDLKQPWCKCDNWMS